MDNNLLSAMCEHIENTYWNRYLDDYNRYGEGSQTVRKSWENWEVADDVTKQIRSMMDGTTNNGDASGPYKDLLNLFQDVNENEIADHIKNCSLKKWSCSWRMAASGYLEKLMAILGGIKENA